jgi:hypothetical protein
MKKFACFFILLSGLSASAQEAGTHDSDPSIQITRPLYSLAYPGSWTADTSKMFGIDLVLRSPKADSLDQFIENINVFVQDLQGRNYYLSKMGKESEAQIRNMVTDVEVLESRLDSTGSQQYYVFSYRGRQGKFLLTTEQRYFLRGEVGIAVTFTLQTGKEKEYQPLSAKIFRSFRLL